MAKKTERRLLIRTRRLKPAYLNNVLAARLGATVPAQRVGFLAKYRPTKFAKTFSFADSVSYFPFIGKFREGIEKKAKEKDRIQRVERINSKIDSIEILNTNKNRKKKYSEKEKVEGMVDFSFRQLKLIGQRSLKLERDVDVYAYIDDKRYKKTILSKQTKLAVYDACAILIMGSLSAGVVLEEELKKLNDTKLEDLKKYIQNYEKNIEPKIERHCVFEYLYKRQSKDKVFKEDRIEEDLMDVAREIQLRDPEYSKFSLIQLLEKEKKNLWVMSSSFSKFVEDNFSSSIEDILEAYATIYEKSVEKELKKTGEIGEGRVSSKEDLLPTLKRGAKGYLTPQNMEKTELYKEYQNYTANIKMESDIQKYLAYSRVLKELDDAISQAEINDIKGLIKNRLFWGFVSAKDASNNDKFVPRTADEQITQLDNVFKIVEENKEKLEEEKNKISNFYAAKFIQLVMNEEISLHDSLDDCMFAINKKELLGEKTAEAKNILDEFISLVVQKEYLYNRELNRAREIVYMGEEGSEGYRINNGLLVKNDGSKVFSIKEEKDARRMDEDSQKEWAVLKIVQNLKLDSYKIGREGFLIESGSGHKNVFTKEEKASLKLNMQERESETFKEMAVEYSKDKKGENLANLAYILSENAIGNIAHEGKEEKPSVVKEKLGKTGVAEKEKKTAELSKEKEDEEREQEDLEDDKEKDKAYFQYVVDYLGNIKNTKNEALVKAKKERLQGLINSEKIVLSERQIKNLNYKYSEMKVDLKQPIDFALAYAEKIGVKNSENIVTHKEESIQLMIFKRNLILTKEEIEELNLQFKLNIKPRAVYREEEEFVLDKVYFAHAKDKSASKPVELTAFMTLLKVNKLYKPAHPYFCEILNKLNRGKGDSLHNNIEYAQQKPTKEKVSSTTSTKRQLQICLKAYFTTISKFENTDGGRDFSMAIADKTFSDFVVTVIKREKLESCAEENNCREEMEGIIKNANSNSEFLNKVYMVNDVLNALKDTFVAHMGEVTEYEGDKLNSAVTEWFFTKYKEGIEEVKEKTGNINSSDIEVENIFTRQNSARSKMKGFDRADVLLAMELINSQMSLVEKNLPLM